MTVEVELNVRNMEATDRIKDYITKKASKLDRYMNGIQEVKVDLDFVKSARSASDRQVAQITVIGPRTLLRTEERAEDLFAAFDKAHDKMQRQMERYKGKRHHGRGDGRSAAEVVEAAPESAAPALLDEPASMITHRKTFKLAPMDENEALEQMRMLGHENFFIFFNVRTNAIDVVYQRRDGSFGLIEPVVE